MLYHLLYPLSETVSAFNVFRYLTFRSVGAALTALLFALFNVFFSAYFLFAILLGLAITALRPPSTVMSVSVMNASVQRGAAERNATCRGSSAASAGAPSIAN